MIKTFSLSYERYTIFAIQLEPPRNSEAHSVISEGATVPQIATIKFGFEAAQRVFKNTIILNKHRKSNQRQLLMKSSFNPLESSILSTPNTQLMPYLRTYMTPTQKLTPQV